MLTERQVKALHVARWFETEWEKSAPCPAARNTWRITASPQS